MEISQFPYFYTVLTGVLVSFAGIYGKVMLSLAFKRRNVARRIDAYVGFWNEHIISPHNSLIHIQKIGTDWEKESSALYKNSQKEDCLKVAAINKKYEAHLMKELTEKKIITFLDYFKFLKEKNSTLAVYIEEMRLYAQSMTRDPTTMISDEEASLLGDKVTNYVSHFREHLSSALSSFNILIEYAYSGGKVDIENARVILFNYFLALIHAQRNYVHIADTVTRMKNRHLLHLLFVEK
ncbi:MAG: hypothetical protein HON43_03545 [Alphaproteobacteria bacterium]|jgi:hypothetical protein|nr:hypothetical protein [Alphaproteobacteria bacterium]MBT5389900.1 hypothetical protein [Alphaproteobacteria bacterium]MBT5540388.1 hypothetical protein [Alphaproteobacteria bacterium]